MDTCSWNLLSQPALVSLTPSSCNKHCSKKVLQISFSSTNKYKMRSLLSFMLNQSSPQVLQCHSCIICMLLCFFVCYCRYAPNELKYIIQLLYNLLFLLFSPLIFEQASTSSGCLISKRYTRLIFGSFRAVGFPSLSNNVKHERVCYLVSFLIWFMGTECLISQILDILWVKLWIERIDMLPFVHRIIVLHFCCGGLKSHKLINLSCYFPFFGWRGHFFVKYSI